MYFFFYQTSSIYKDGADKETPSHRICLFSAVLSLMLRKENAIKCIDINNKISFTEPIRWRYSDISKRAWNVSESNNRHTKKFYKMSGLSVNEDKTKAIWIDSVSRSDLRLCRDYNFHWEQKY